MTSFSFGVQSTCLVVLVSLLVYTLALMRTGRLSAHVTVRWVLAEIAAIGAVVLWGRLPVITYTSSLGDRELLVVLAVLFFGLIAFLMLDSLQRISAQGAQIRRLVQELALLQAGRGESHPASGRFGQHDAPTGAGHVHDARGPGPFAIMLFVMWVVGCVAAYVLQSEGRLPDSITNMLTAAYKQ